MTFIALLSFSFISCNDDDKMPNAEYTEGVASSFINNLSWEGEPFFNEILPDSLYRINIYKYSVEGFIRNKLSLQYFPLKLEKIQLFKYNAWDPFINPSATFRTLLSDGDVLATTYNVIENDTIEDFIEFTDINLLTNEATGKFQASMVIQDTITRIFATFPDTIIISNGFFKMKIME